MMYPQERGPMKLCAICKKDKCVCGCDMYEETETDPDDEPCESRGASDFALFFVFCVGFICGVMFVAVLVGK